MAVKKTVTRKKTPASSKVRKTAAAAPAKRVAPVTLSPASHAAIAAMQKSLHLATADDAIALAARLAKALDSVPDAASMLVLVELDAKAKEYRLATSDAVELRGWLGTEADLVKQAAATTNRSIDALARDGVLFIAKRELAMAQRAASRASEPMPTDGSRRQTSGIPGAADARIQVAYDRLKAEEPNAKITPARLAGAAGTGFHTAKRWIDRHPEAVA